MPLTQCPDCGRNVSTSAVQCPGCGRPLNTAADRAAELAALQRKPARSAPWWKLGARSAADEQRVTAFNDLFYGVASIVALAVIFFAYIGRMVKAVGDFFAAPIGMKGEATPEVIGAIVVCLALCSYLGNWTRKHAGK